MSSIVFVVYLVGGFSNLRKLRSDLVENHIKSQVWGILERVGELFLILATFGEDFCRQVGPKTSKVGAKLAVKGARVT